MSSSGLARLVRIESGGQANIVNASGHVGLGQFSAETWRTFGGGGDPKNPADAIAAIQRYAVSNQRYLTGVLGRPATDAELYLAHQQGPAGAAKLLTNPNASAVSLLGRGAVVGNGGTADMTAAQFASMWTHKFDGTAPSETISYARAAYRSLSGGQMVADPMAAPLPSASGGPGWLDVKQSAFQSILDDPNASDEVKQKALADVNQLLASQQIADGASKAARQDRSEKAVSGLMSAVIAGNAGPTFLQDLAANQDILPDQKEALRNALISHAEESQANATAAYGPGWWPAFQQILKPVGDPSRISDPSEILRMVKPGVLTLPGAQDLIKIASATKKDVNQVSINQAKEAQMRYGLSKVTFDAVALGATAMPGVPLRQDPDVARFTADFVTRYNKQFDAFMADGKKDPYEFFTSKRTDEIVQGIRDPRQMAVARLAADEAMVTLPQDTTVPPPPPGVDQKGWDSVMKIAALVPIVSPKGVPVTMPQWQQMVSTLTANPSANNRKFFDHYTEATFRAAITDPELLKFQPSELVLAALGVDAGSLPPDERPHIVEAKKAIAASGGGAFASPDPGAVAPAPAPSTADIGARVPSLAAPAAAPPAAAASAGARQLETPGVGPPTLPPPIPGQPMSAFQAPAAVAPVRSPAPPAKPAVPRKEEIERIKDKSATVTLTHRETVGRVYRDELAKTGYYSEKELDQMTEEFLAKTPMTTQ
jgi:hypothetical protein